MKTLSPVLLVGYFAAAGAVYSQLDSPRIGAGNLGESIEANALPRLEFSYTLANGEESDLTSVSPSLTSSHPLTQTGPKRNWSDPFTEWVTTPTENGLSDRGERSLERSPDIIFESAAPLGFPFLYGNERDGRFGHTQLTFDYPTQPARFDQTSTAWPELVSVSDPAVWFVGVVFILAAFAGFRMNRIHRPLD